MEVPERQLLRSLRVCWLLSYMLLYLNVVVLWCRAVWFPHSSSNDVACVVVRSRPSSGQHLLDPRLCVCQVSNLIHLQLERETLAKVDDTLSLVSLVSHVSENPRASSLLLWATPPGMSGRTCLHEKLDDTVGDTLVDLARPSLHVAERLLVRDTEDYGDIVCAVSVEHVRWDLELTTAVSHCC